jgi:hypothetical protein
MVNGELATAVNGAATADNDSVVTPDVPPVLVDTSAADAATFRPSTDDPAISGRSGAESPADPVAAELASLRHSLEHAVDLYRGYRESAAERAQRITQLLTDLDEREATLTQLRDEVQRATREHQKQLEAAGRRYRRLCQRRSVRLALGLAAAVKKARGPRGRPRQS